MTKQEEARKRLDEAIEGMALTAMREIGYTLDISEAERCEMIERCFRDGTDIEEFIVVMREHLDKTIAHGKRHGIRRVNH